MAKPAFTDDKTDEWVGNALVVSILFCVACFAGFMLWLVLNG